MTEEDAPLKDDGKSKKKKTKKTKMKANGEKGPKFKVVSALEKKGSLTKNCFEAVQKARAGEATRVPIPPDTPEEERTYACERLRASLWDVRIEGDEIVLTDPPPRRPGQPREPSTSSDDLLP